MVGVALGIAVAACLYWYSDERQIRRLLNEVAASVSQEEAMGMAGVAEVMGLKNLLAPDVTLDPGPPYTGTISGADQITSTIMKMRVLMPVVLLTFVDVQVAIDAADSATVHATATITTRTTDGEQNVDAREIVLSLAKRDGRWVIAAVEAVPVLEPVL